MARIGGEAMKHNVITLEAARVLFNKVEAAKGPIAVFAANGGWNATKVSSQNFARQIQRTPHLLVGIYDLESRIDWIADDLAIHGIK